MIDEEGQSQDRCIDIVQAVNHRVFGSSEYIVQTWGHPGILKINVLSDDYRVQDREYASPPVVVLSNLFEIRKETDDIRRGVMKKLRDVGGEQPVKLSVVQHSLQGSAFRDDFQVDVSR